MGGRVHPVLSNQNGVVMDENNIPHIVNGGASIMPHEGMKPLDAETIMQLYEQYIETQYASEINVLGFARAIEKAHGIE